MPSPDELRLQDLEERFASVEVAPAYSRLYDEPGLTSKMFGFYQERLTALFEFMNYKASTNGHFKAGESRELIALIRDIGETGAFFVRLGTPFTIDERYQRAMDYSSTFLRESGGSPIPEGFVPIELLKYEPAFTTIGAVAHVPERTEPPKLTMIGSGSYANVYRYTDPFYGIRFAVKRMKRGLSEQDQERFRREFAVLRELSFPYVLEVYRYDECRDEYVLEYCDETLRKFISRTNPAPSFRTRKRIALQFLYAMNYLHSKKHLHRDVSLQNVLIKQYDGAAIVKLSDFGLFKHADSDLTRTESSIKGTVVDPALESFKDYSLTHEMYAIGYVLSFIFSGRQAIGALRGAVRAIVDRCVNVDQSSRYAKVLDIIRDLEPIETSGLTSESGTPA